MKKEKQKTGRKKQMLLTAVLLCAMVLGACGSAADTEAASAANRGESASPAAAAGDTAAAGDNASVPDTGDAAPETTPASEPPVAAPAAQSPAAAPASHEELDGSIEEIGASSFKVSETYTEDLGEDGLLAVSPANPDPADFIDVRYSEETVFIIRSSSDMGITCTDSEATAADLEVGRSMIATGTRDGSVFTASEIVIYHFD